MDHRLLEFLITQSVVGWIRFSGLISQVKPLSPSKPS